MASLLPGQLVLTVVPARGNSKGIPRKNIAVVRGKPLLCHICDTASQLFRVVVSTEDPEIRSVALSHGYEVVDRPRELAEDDVPVSDVARHACESLDYDGPVIVAQPTCPNVTLRTLELLVFQLEDHDAATLITPNTHILRDHQSRLSLAVNRQWMMSYWREVGVRAFGSASLLTSAPTGTVEVEAPEGLDIDTHGELWEARSRASILFEVCANDSVGTGHLRRADTLAAALSHHDISFLFINSADWATTQWPTREIAWPPADVVVIDTLDTTVEQVARHKANGSAVITLEDRGPGARIADRVINALYPLSGLAHELSGSQVADLRPEFVGLPPFQVTDKRRVLLMFGGTDPSGLGERMAKLFPDATWIRPGDDVSVAWEMANHDVLVTSAGRTVYEAQAVGIPCVVLAQNQRESTHAHLDGTIYLGLGSLVSDERTIEVVEGLLGDRALRKEMSRNRIDGRGTVRIVREIENLIDTPSG